MMGELCNLKMCVIEHTLVGTVYMSEKDSEMKSAVLKFAEVLCYPKSARYQEWKELNPYHL